jgi:hypothetical protein
MPQHGNASAVAAGAAAGAARHRGDTSAASSANPSCNASPDTSPRLRRPPPSADPSPLARRPLKLSTMCNTMAAPVSSSAFEAMHAAFAQPSTPSSSSVASPRGMRPPSSSPSPRPPRPPSAQSSSPPAPPPFHALCLRFRWPSPAQHAADTARRLGLLCTAVREKSEEGGASITRATATKEFREYMRHAGVGSSQEKMSYSKLLRALRAMSGESCTEPSRASNGRHRRVRPLVLLILAC